MPQKYETHLKWVLITCAGVLAGSLGVFISVLSVIVSPLLSLILTPKPLFIGEGKAGVTSRLQLPPEKIRPRYVCRPSSDKSSSPPSTAHSSNSTTLSTLTAGNNSPRSPSPKGTKFRVDTRNASESPIPSQPSTVSLTLVPSSPPKPPKNGLRTYLGMRKRSTILDDPVPEEASPMTGNSGIDQGKDSHDRAEIIVSPPTPSSSVFLYSTPGPSETHVSTSGKPAARFVKSHSKRHSLTAACPRKRRSGKRSPNSPTPKSESPVTTPVVGSKWHIATRAAQRKKRKSLQIVPPPLRSATSPVVIDSGDGVGVESIYEEPITIPRPHTPHLPLTPPRQGPVRTRPYEAPYFFPTPGSPEAIGYVERVREERRSALVYSDPASARSKKDLIRASTMSSLEKEGISENTKLRGEGGHEQPTEDSGKKRPKNSGKGSGTKNSSPSLSPDSELGVRVRNPILRKTSAPAQLSSSGIGSPPTTPNHPQTQRQGSLGIMRILGKH